MKYKYQPKTKGELKALCDDETIHLGDIDTSLITDMSELFKGSSRNDRELGHIECHGYVLYVQRSRGF